jgi:hypothetical protein
MKYVATIACLVVLAGLARAGDKSNPTGTWKYTTEIGGQSREITIKLKLDGGKLTGTVSAGDTETKIEDGKFKDGEVSFKVVREAGGNTITLKYKGKVMGDTIKGKRELERDGQTNTREFVAKRAKE